MDGPLMGKFFEHEVKNIRERIERSDRVDKLLVKQSFRRSRKCNALKLIKNDREWKRKGIFEDTKLGYVTFPELEG